MIRSSMHLLLAILVCLGAAQTYAQPLSSTSTGPVFDDYGAVFDNVQPDYMPAAGTEYKVLFDVWQGPEAVDVLNPRLDALARFMNMHARAGVKPENMHLAVVLHGSAGKAVLDHAAYRERFGTDNPDLELLQALSAHGVRIMICGQSAAARGYPKQSMIEPVQISLSAMSAIFGLQNEGYRLLP